MVAQGLEFSDAERLDEILTGLPTWGSKYKWDRKNLWLSTNDSLYIENGTR